ncbi:MAG: ABC transporter ATP-binding protein [Candidatus Omnitrophica bacterium]|nr:ABC transporter ATP-binding protein [Candidatus Omnitrophota bacterium]
MTPPIEDTRLVRFEHVSKKYGSAFALRDVSFEIRAGEIVGLLGPNGAGKTTTLRILSGFFSPSQGKVWIKGTDLFKYPQKAKKSIGYLPEAVSLYPDMKVAEFLDYVAKLKGVPRRGLKEHMAAKMALCGLTEVGHRLIGRLSKGYRQRVGIAQALLGDPQILILDEPTSGLDPKQITEIRTLIKLLGKERAVILSTHILSEVSIVCDKVIMINQGKVLVRGGVQELESCLKDRQEISVRVKGRGHRGAAVELLRSIPEVEALRVREEPGDELWFVFEVAQEEDLRARITKLFVQRDIPLVEIHRIQLTLEDIFLHLLQAGRFARPTL